MEDVFKSRPFKIRNADEYDISNILNLFVSPISGLATPFDYENSIIKGRMGSGKTMYLRANHAAWLSALVPSLIEKSDEVVLPIMIRLNDFQHIKEPSDVYKAIIIKIIEELTSIYLYLEDNKKLKDIQTGLRLLPKDINLEQKISDSLTNLAKLGSDEFVQRVTTELGLKGGVKAKFLQLSADWKNKNFFELKQKPNPGMKDIEECYKNLLADQKGQILLLLDEAGSLDRLFFSENNGQCFFEILMNQFRTASFIRTKIAVYPNSFSDMLTETRYGDTILLEDNVRDEQGYFRFRRRTVEIVKNYLNSAIRRDSEHVSLEEIFVVNNDLHCGDAIEQLIYASNGNMRRLIHLLDLTMDAAFSNHGSAKQITLQDAINALSSHAAKFEAEFGSSDLELLQTIVAACKARTTFKFKFPGIPLSKYTNRSKEYNVVNVDELGSGRRATTYTFDYAYAVYKDIPTHREMDADKLYRNRSIDNGKWLTRKATISDEIIQHALLPGKLEGTVDYMKETAGFILTDTNEQYFFSVSAVIETDKNKPIIVGKRVRFYPTKLGDSNCAMLLEVL